MRKSVIAIGIFLALFAIGYIFLSPALGPQFTAIVALSTLKTSHPIVILAASSTPAPTSSSTLAHGASASLNAIIQAIKSATSSQGIISAAQKLGYITVTSSIAGWVPSVTVEQTSTDAAIGWFIGPQY
jgi:hypothetical protein